MRAKSVMMTSVQSALNDRLPGDKICSLDTLQAVSNDLKRQELKDAPAPKEEPFDTVDYFINITNKLVGINRALKDLADDISEGARKAEQEISNAEQKNEKLAQLKKLLNSLT